MLFQEKSVHSPHVIQVTSAGDAMVAWAWLGLTLALLAPGAIAFLWKYSTRVQVSVGRSAVWLLLFVLLLVAVAAIALAGEHLTWRDVGFARTSWASIPYAVALTSFFIAVFGPIATRALSRFGSESFDAGQRALAALPQWYLFCTITIVGAGEEWLDRGYAIEQLQLLNVGAPFAAIISLLAFGLVHLPLWGVGVSLTTIAS
jgi:membrane protease YdiL (CAAX protease family)